MNKITFTGRVVADAELKFIPSGDAILNFRVASDVGFGDKKVTNWFGCQIWGKRGEALQQYLGKGQQVTIFGQLTLREWQNKDGAKVLSPDVRVDEVELQGGQKSEPDVSQSSRPAPSSRNSEQFGEEIPF
jgi:single-strand DNA-binding protein